MNSTILFILICSAGSVGLDSVTGISLDFIASLNMVCFIIEDDSKKIKIFINKIKSLKTQSLKLVLSFKYSKFKIL